MSKAKKLPSGNWRVQAQITVDGITIRKSFTHSERRKAELAATAWQSGVQQEQIENITLAAAYERYISAKENVLSPSTIRNYKILSNNALQDIMQIKLERLNNEIIQRSINQFAATHSPKTVRNCHGLLSAVLTMFRPDFTLHTKLPQKVKTAMFIPTDEVIRNLMSAVKDTSLEVPVLLAAFGALRCGEICALTSDDVFDKGIHVNKSMVCDSEGKWHIKPPKTVSSDRYVELPPFVIEQLQEKNGRIVNLTPHTISTNFNRFLRQHNIPHFRFHDLRHYNVSILHAMGIPDKYIMAQGGWSTNYTMQNVYNHIMSDKQTKFAKRISNHFEKIYSVENHSA